MTQKELNELLDQHDRWLQDPKKGRRAILCIPLIQGLSFKGRNLEKAVFCGSTPLFTETEEKPTTDFSGANLKNAVFDGSKDPSLIPQVWKDRLDPYLDQVNKPWSEKNGTPRTGWKFSFEDFKKQYAPNAEFDETMMRSIEFVVHEGSSFFSYRLLPGSVVQDSLFSEADLSGLDFEEIQFDSVTFNDSNMNGCRFFDSGFRMVFFTGCDLRESSFKLNMDARLTFKGCDLKKATFEDHSDQYSDVSFEDCNLQNANLKNWSGQLSFKRTVLRGAYLQNARLGYQRAQGLDLSGAQLQNADLSGANLSRANLTGANLTGADLNGAELSKSNLSGADLSGAILEDIDLNGAQLEGCRFDDPSSGFTKEDLETRTAAHNLWLKEAPKGKKVFFDLEFLNRADFSGRDLSGAVFSGASLQNANFSRAKLQGTQFKGGVFEKDMLSASNSKMIEKILAFRDEEYDRLSIKECHPESCNMAIVYSTQCSDENQCVEKKFWEEGDALFHLAGGIPYEFRKDSYKPPPGFEEYLKLVDPEKIHTQAMHLIREQDADRSICQITTGLRYANFEYADLRGANLSFSDVEGAVFRKADLSNAQLRCIKASSVDLSGSTLKNSDISEAHLCSAKLKNANLRNANLNWSDLKWADLSDADLSDADLSHADLMNADLCNADLTEANLSGAHLYGSNFTGADLRGADFSGAIMDSAVFDDCKLDGVKGMNQKES